MVSDCVAVDDAFLSVSGVGVGSVERSVVFRGFLVYCTKSGAAMVDFKFTQKNCS